MWLNCLKGWYIEVLFFKSSISLNYTFTATLNRVMLRIYYRFIKLGNKHLLTTAHVYSVPGNRDTETGVHCGIKLPEGLL